MENIIENKNECNPKVNRKEVFKRFKPYVKKWMTDKHKQIIVCGFPIITGLPIIAVIMIALVIPKNGNVDQKKSVAQHYRVVHSINIRQGDNDKEKIKIDSTQNSASEIENGSTDQMKNSAVVSSIGDRQNQIGPSRQDHFAGIYFRIANEFADEQLWQIASEYYYRVFEKNHSNAELLARIAKMKSEIQNQNIFEEGQALIKKGHYKEGIVNLQQIPESSMYFHIAAQFVSEAEANMAKTEHKK